jgi:PKD repeat protein
MRKIGIIREEPGCFRSIGRTVLVILMLVGMTLGGGALAQGNDETVMIDPPLSQVAPGETFTVTVEVEGAVDLVGYEFSLDFDPDVVEVTGVMDDGFLGAEPDVVLGPDYDVGTVTFAAFMDPPYDGGATGDGTLAVISLTAVGTGGSPLDLNGVALFDADSEEIVPIVMDGAVNSAVTLEVVPAERWINPGEFTQTVMIRGVEDLGGYEFSMAFDPGIVQVTDVADASFLGSTGRDVIPFAPDIDNVAGLLTFGAASFGEEPGANGDGELVTITFETVAEGDTVLDLFDEQVTDTAGVGQLTAAFDGVVHVVDVTVLISTPAEVFEEETFTIQVMVDDAENLAGYEFSLDWDPMLLEVDDVEDGGFLNDDVIPTEPDIDNDNGTMTFAALSTGGGVNGDGVLAEITLTALEVDADQTSPLDLHDVTLFDPLANPTVPVLIDGEVLVRNCIAVDITDLTSDSPVALGETMHFTATVTGSEPIDYTWDFGGAGTLVGGGEDMGAFVYDEPGTYTVTLTAENFCGTDEETLVVNVCEPVSIDDFVSDSPVEIGETMHFTATVSGSEPIDYTWDFGGAGTLVGGGEETGAYIYDEPGTYTVTLTAENCPVSGPFTDEAVLVVTVTCDPVMIDDFVSDSPVTLGETMHFTATVSGSEPVSYTWDFGGAGTLVGGGEETGAYVYDEAGTYTVTLTVENPCGTAEETLVVEVCGPAEIVSLTSDSPVVIGETMHFTATVSGSEPISYTWDFGGDGTLVGGGEDTGAFVYDEVGTYTVTLSVENACGEDEETLIVTVEKYRLFLPVVAKNFTP